MECIGNCMWFFWICGGGGGGGGVRCVFLFLCLCDGFIFYIHFLGCLVRRVSCSYLGIGCDMSVRRRVFVLGLRRL